MPEAIYAKFDDYAGPLPEAPAGDPHAFASRVMPLSVDLTVYENLPDIEAAWRAFERNADCTVFQTFDWLATWQRHVGIHNDVRPAIVVGRIDGGDILFILPLATRPIGLARELMWLGSELCDYNAPLLAPDFSTYQDVRPFGDAWRHITERLQENPRLRYDFIRLEKMPATVGKQKNPMLTLGVTLNPSGAYSTQLTGNWEAFYATKRSASTRSRDRSKRKRLSELGELRLVRPDNATDALATLDTLIAQKSRSFARMGVANLFARPGYVEFYRALAADPQLGHLVHLSRLDCGPHAAAANVGLTFRDRYYHLLASHDDGDMSRFGPGVAHLHDLLGYAINRGLKIFDFTIGDERYKLDWCDGAEKLYDHLSIATWRGAFVYAPILAKSWLKRQIKQTPVLWKAFSRARTLYGSLLRR